MFSTLEQTLMAYIHTLPLETFVFVASIVEEIIAPIPSPTVMVLSGSVAQFQERALLALIPLAIIGAVGKTLGALVVYGVAHKAETTLMPFCKRFFNVSHEDVAKLGSKLGKGAKDYLFLTFLRALPIMPSVVLSAGSGLLKIPLPLFIFSTFFGTIVRDGFYLYAGYVGLEALSVIIDASSHAETLIEVCVAVAVLVFVYYKWRQKKHATNTTT